MTSEQKTSVQFLVATVDGRVSTNESIVDLDNKIVVNQLRDTTSSDSEPYFINTSERGLAKSRNMALKHANGDICYIADDDLRFVKNASAIIRRIHEEHTEADVIVFPLCFEEGSNDIKKHLPPLLPIKIRVMGVSSCEISFKTKAIKKANLAFDEQFGLGAHYPSGEENIFLSDCLDRGLKIFISDEYVAIHPRVSSGSVYNSEMQIRAKGAILGRSFGKWSYFLLFLFALKSHKLYRKNYTIAQFLRLTFTEARALSKSAAIRGTRV